MKVGDRVRHNAFTDCLGTICTFAEVDTDHGGRCKHSTKNVAVRFDRPLFSFWPQHYWSCKRRDITILPQMYVSGNELVLEEP